MLFYEKSFGLEFLNAQKKTSLWECFIVSFLIALAMIIAIWNLAWLAIIVGVGVVVFALPKWTKYSREINRNTRTKKLLDHYVKDKDLVLTGLKNLNKITKLSLGWTKISNPGLVHLKSFTKLMELDLTCTKISNAGLVPLKSLKNIAKISLGWTKISNAGLTHLKPLTKLMELDLTCTKISNAGLVHLKPLTNITALYLGGTKISEIVA